ncbi:bestrophin-3 isoform X2 [Rhinatrema bivittatum]|uniref:bestrophin-3 isoform X2 n=1 Tax=Rhinatrema bivittatum TaxID=194408 RepID=UPI0011296ABE|nr:bestrophin-3 isoform X2 [Rhinatrema bivittatum]
MTVTYSSKVANATFFGFHRLLLKWRGSIYKLLYREFLLFITLYTLLSVMYRFFLTESQKRYFEKLSLYCDKYAEQIPVTFVLGFYVTLVVNRWWNQFVNMPWPDRLMFLISSNVHGRDEYGRLLRRTLMRYVNLTSLIIFRSVSTAVYKRFPTMDYVVDAGFMTAEERKIFDSLKSPHLKYWVPFIWFGNLASKARKEGRIRDSIDLQIIMKVSLLAVDEMHMNLPKMNKDIYWNDSDVRPPYTLAAADYCIPSFLGSTVDMGLPDSVFLRGEDFLWDEVHDRPRRQQSVLKRVKRFLSVHENPDTPKRIISRQDSDTSDVFFPTSDTSGITGSHDVSARGRSLIANAKRHEQAERHTKLPSTMGDLSTIREVSRSERSSSQQSNPKEAPATQTLQVPQTSATAAASTRSVAHNEILQTNVPLVSQTATDPLQSKSDPNIHAFKPQQTLSNEGKSEQDPVAESQTPTDVHKGGTGDGKESSSRSNQSSVDTAPLLATSERNSSSCGKDVASTPGPKETEGTFHLLKHLDAKETDIIEFNNEEEKNL